MTVVVGTAGHIDHGKTTLLHALTGMDADRLPDEKRRGLTIDIGYARAAPDDGPVIDFVDVPGHDKLVGNMLVGAGEIDACLLVVAADDGPRAQTLEHLALLDALRIGDGVVALTKTDRVDDDRITAVRDKVRTLLARTILADAPIVSVSAQTGVGVEALKAELAILRDQLTARGGTRPPGRSMAIDRVFSIKGFGAVVTGTSRGAAIARGDHLDVLPGGQTVRVRGVQVHDVDVSEGPDGGRVALNLGGIEHAELRRGQVLADEQAGLIASSRVLVALEQPVALTGEAAPSTWPPRDGAEARLHIATEQCAVSLGRGGRDDVALDERRVIAMLRLERPVALGDGRRFVLRQPHPADLLAGGLVLDPMPARGPARRRQTAPRLERLDAAVRADDGSAVEAALTELHGIRSDASSSAIAMADDVRGDLEELAVAAVGAGSETENDRLGLALAELRRIMVTAARRRASITAEVGSAAADLVIDSLVAKGGLARNADSVRLPGQAPSVPDPAVAAQADVLVASLDVPAPPPLSTAVAAAGCPPATLRELEREGRIVVVDDDLAWSRDAYDALVSTALSLAREAPMTPAALRDATGTSRKFVMALLEDLARRGVLTRTPAGHVPGPRA